MPIGIPFAFKKTMPPTSPSPQGGVPPGTGIAKTARVPATGVDFYDNDGGLAQSDDPSLCPWAAFGSVNAEFVTGSHD